MGFERMSDVIFTSSADAAKERAVPAQIWHRSAMRSELPTLIGIGLDALGPGSDSSPSRVVGREAEMHLLSQALERTRIGGEPGSITLLGPKDAGKTRLLEAFVDGAKKLESPSVRIIKVAGLGGEHRYGLFARLLRQRFELRDDMTDDEARWELRARVSEVLGDRKVGDILYFLGRLLELPFRESPITRAIEHDESEMDLVCRAVARSFFEADARRAPLCLVLEDVHLCEDASLGLLRSLVESVDAPFFVLCTARTELLSRSVAWARSERHKLVHLAAQTHDETAVAARIAVLSAEEQSLLEGAARMGSMFWAGALIAIERATATPPSFWDPENDQPKTRKLLASLAERDYVLKLPDSTFPGDEEYIFKHSLERERIAASTSPEVGRHLSRVIGDWLDRQPTLRDYEENLRMLAEHRQRAGLAVAAGRAFLEAGEVARRRDAITAAADSFAKGIVLLGEEDAGVRLEALRQLSALLVRQGKRDAALERFAEMAALAFRLNSSLHGAEAHVGTARLKADAGDLTAAVRHMRAAVGLYAEAGADDTVGLAAAELDKLLDKITVATVKHATTAGAMNGTSAAQVVPHLAVAAPEAPAAIDAIDAAPAPESAPVAEAAPTAPTTAEVEAATTAELAAAVESLPAIDATAHIDEPPPLEAVTPAEEARAFETIEAAKAHVDEVSGWSDIPNEAAVEPVVQAAAEPQLQAPAIDGLAPGAPEATADTAADEAPMEEAPITVRGEALANMAQRESERAMRAAAAERAASLFPEPDVPALPPLPIVEPEPASATDDAVAASSEPVAAAPVAPIEPAFTLPDLSSYDRPTPPTPLPAVAALAAATLPSAEDAAPAARRAPDSEMITAPGLELIPPVDDDADAVDVELSDVVESGPPDESSASSEPALAAASSAAAANAVTEWIDLKSADPDMGAVGASPESVPTVLIRAPEAVPAEAFDADSAPTLRKVTAAPIEPAEPTDLEEAEKAKTEGNAEPSGG
jgi:hypothetical protein